MEKFCMKCSCLFKAYQESYHLCEGCYYNYKEKKLSEETHDYHWFCNINTPKEDREHINIGDIWRNEIRCTLCHDVVRSKNSHHMERCSCEAVAIDGGSNYSRILGKDYADLSIPFNDA